jgi:hypothetical protein
MKIDDQLILFPFKGKDATRKFFVGGLLALCGMLIPLLYIPISGYKVRVIRRTLDDGVPSLPAWDDWGDLILSGLKVWLVSIVYGLPLVVVTLCINGVVLAGIMTSMFGATEESFLAIYSGVALMLIGFAGFGVMMLLWLPVMFFTPVAVVRMVVHDSVKSAFQFGEVWREIKSGFKHYILAFVVYLAMSMGVSMAASLLMYTICLACLYPFILALGVVYGQVMEGALYGLAYRETQALALPGGEQTEAAR